MGKLIDGRWHKNDELDLEQMEDGSFKRGRSTLRSWITEDGAPGPTGQGGYAAEPGRYHLYLSEGCPWAHRVWLVHTLKGLSELVSLSFVTLQPSAEDGWVFDDEHDRYRDPLAGRRALHEVYRDGAPDFTGRATVPVLFDKRTGTIVNNESADILRMLGHVFDAHLDAHLDDGAGRALDLYPEPLRDEVDEWNERVYRDVNNAVYQAGFARSEEAHEAALDRLFSTLAELDAHLEETRYLCGDVLTEADLRLFPTLVRFDAAYASAFKCDWRRIVDYDHLWAYTRDLYAHPGFADTVLPTEVYRRGYSSIPFAVGHSRVVSRGPRVDFSAPQDRARLAA
jgi:putative glutathione S-transferase